jgi:uncharacterized membrane protein YfcA
MYGIGFDARSAVPLNLLTSLVTLIFALAVRSGAVSLAAVVPFMPAMIGLLAGGMASASYGARPVAHISDKRLVRLIAALLGALGLLLITEAACRASAILMLNCRCRQQGARLGCDLSRPCRSLRG